MSNVITEAVLDTLHYFQDEYIGDHGRSHTDHLGLTDEQHYDYQSALYKALDVAYKEVLG